MKSAVENLTPTRVKLTIEVPAEELKPYLDTALSEIGKQVQVPGFRAGKVPTRLVEQRVGRGAIVQEAVNEALPDFYSRAVEEGELSPIGQPEVDVTEVPLEAEQQLAFTVEVDVRPEITLPDASGLTLTVDAVTITDEDVDARLTGLRERFGSLTGVDRAVQDGDFVSLDLRAEVEGEEVDSVEGVSYEVGSENMLDGLDEALVGMTKGESRDFTAPLAGGERAGQEARCTVTVQAVKVRELPEVDEEFVQLASEFDTVEQLRESLRGEVEQAKRFEQGIAARDQLLETLLEQTDIPVPDSIVEAEVTQHLEQEGRQEDTEHRAEVEESTRKAVQTQFLLDELAKREEVEVGQAELVEYLMAQSQQYGMDPNQFAQMIDQQGQIQAIVGDVARRKALAAVLDKATITDSEGNAVNLDELMPAEEEGEGDVSDAVTDDAQDDAVTDGDQVETAEATESAEATETAEAGTDPAAEPAQDASRD